jgi:hypothetical protein
MKIGITFIFRFYLVVLVPVGLSSFLNTSSAVLVRCRSFFCRPAWTFGVQITDTEEILTANKTCRRCKNDERPTGTNN